VAENRSGRITISATYSPPKYHKSILSTYHKKEQYINFFKILGNRFIAAGDYNAKCTHWRSRLILLKGHELLKTVETRIGNEELGNPVYRRTYLLAIRQ